MTDATTFTATFSNPLYNYTGGTSGASTTVPCAVCTIDKEFSTISSMQVWVRRDVIDFYDVESGLDSNPLQLNSTVIIRRGTNIWFKGFVKQKPLQMESDSGNLLQVEIEGYEGVLTQTLCNRTDSYRWTVESDSVELVEVPLIATSDFPGFADDTLWPDPFDAGLGEYAWLGDAFCQADQLTAAFLIGHDEIILSTTNQGLEPRGWVRVNNEWCTYDGYDNDTPGGNYRLKDVKRAQLGSVEANHAIDDWAVNKIAKEIAPRMIFIEQDEASTGDWLPLRIGETLDYDSRLGCFIVPTAAGDYRGTYSVYDSDATLDTGSESYSVEDIVRIVCTADNDYGGAGFVDGQLDFDNTGIFINRFEYDPARNAEYAWSLVQDLLETLNLNTTYNLWYNHSEGKLNFKRLQIKAIPDVELSNVSRVLKELAIDETFSGVLVRYKLDQAINKARESWSYYRASTGVDGRPDFYRATESGGANHRSGEAPDGWVDAVAAGNAGMRYALDNRLDSKLAAYFEDNDPGGPFEFADFWFGDDAPIVNINRIKLAVNAYRVIEGYNRSTAREDFNYQVRLEACDDYDTATHTGTWVDMGCMMSGYPGKDALSAQAEFRNFAISNVNAIRIVFDYMAGRKAVGDYYWGIVHNFFVDADVENYQFVQTTATDDLGGNFIYVPETHYKLRGGVNSSGGAGSPRVLMYDIGASSDGAALTLAKTLLTMKLVQYSQRHYEYRGVLLTIPELGDTIAVDETGDGSADYTGILMGMTADIRDGGIVYSFRLWNPDSEPLTV